MRTAECRGRTHSSLAFFWAILFLAVGWAGAATDSARAQCVALASLEAVQAYAVEEDSPERLREVRKDLRQGLRRFRRVVAHALRSWVLWLPSLLVGFGWLVLVGAWDRAVWGQLRGRGIRAAAKELGRGAAVYVRLLRYPGAPGVGKVLVVAALVYTAASRDVIADVRPVIGLLDDAVLLGIVGRSFLRMCPDQVIERHASAVVRTRRQRVRADQASLPGSENLVG